jgi:hypothetical protein
MQSRQDATIGKADDEHVDPVTSRNDHRLSTLHALDTDHLSLDALNQLVTSDGQIANFLYLGRLSGYYQRAHTQFPTVLATDEYSGARFSTKQAGDNIKIDRGRVWLFRVPNGGLIAGLTLDFSCPLRDCIPLLADAYYSDVLIDGHAVLDRLRKVTADPLVRDKLVASELATHSHQLLFVAGQCHDLVRSSSDAAQRQVDHDLVRRLIYRYDAPYREDSGTIRFPAEANRGRVALAACGPYVSVFAGQQDYIENAALIAAIQLVGSATLLGAARSQAYAALSGLRTLHTEIDDPARRPSHRVARRRLAQLSETVGRLELDLSFGIEAFQEVGALVPSLRVSGVHRELFEAAVLPHQTDSVAQMLDRLARAIAAEAASVLSTERGHDERRRLIWGVAVGFTSFIAVPLTLIFGFFAVTTSDVARSTSLLDIGRYKWFYATVAGLMLVTMCLAFATWLITRDRADS